MIDLRNDDGRYQSPGEGNLAVLKLGSQLEFSPRLYYAQGKETSQGIVFWLDGWEHVNSGGKSTLTLYGIDGWHLLESWRARHQFRWNKDSNDMSVKQILEFVLARVGLKLEAMSQSSVVTGFYPDFTVHPDDSGDLITSGCSPLFRICYLSKGCRLIWLIPRSQIASAYSYGQNHSILQGKYHSSSWPTNQVRIEGYDAVNGTPIITDVFSWEQMEYFSDRIKQIADRNIGTVTAGQALAGAYLRKAEIESLARHDTGASQLRSAIIRCH